MNTPEAMTNRLAYAKGWNASRRTVTCDLDAAEERFEAKHGAKFVMSFIDGWSDYAADAPKWSTLKPDYLPGLAYISGDSSDRFGWFVFVFISTHATEGLGTYPTRGEAEAICAEYNAAPVEDVEDIPVSDLQAGRTYRFDTESIGSAGRVTVVDVENTDGKVYVTGYWQHDGGNAPIDTGLGYFDLDDHVTDVTDSDPVVPDVEHPHFVRSTFTATWLADTGTGERFETAPCSTVADALAQADIALHLYDIPRPDVDGIRVNVHKP